MVSGDWRMRHAKHRERRKMKPKLQFAEVAREREMLDVVVQKDK